MANSGWHRGAESRCGEGVGRRQCHASGRGSRAPKDGTRSRSYGVALRTFRLSPFCHDRLSVVLQQNAGDVHAR
jgi:hypothetical protein